MKAKNARRALLMSVLSLFVCVSMLVGTTFAWFTDSVTSANNIIKSGTLDVTMEWMNGTEDPVAGTWTDASTGAIFNYDLWEPGYTEVRHIKIANVGNLALKYQIQILANGEVSDLADVIDVYYVDPAVPGGVTDRTMLDDSNKLGTLSKALEDMPATANGNLLAEEEVTLTIALKMQETAGNEYQNKSIGSDFSIILLATQYTHEEDSFDNQYDLNAAWPTYAVGNGTLTPGATELVIYAMAEGESKPVATVTIPAAALAEGKSASQVIVVPTVQDPSVTVADNESARTFDVSVTNIKEGNTAPIDVVLRVGTGLTGVKLYHKNVEIPVESYNSVEGTVTFTTTNFSPFTVVFEKAEDAGGDTGGDVGGDVVDVVTVTNADELKAALENVTEPVVIDAAGLTVDINQIGTDFPNGIRAYNIPGGVTIKNFNVIGSYRGGNYLMFEGSPDQEIVFENCTFEPGGRAMGLGLCGSEGGISSVVYKNCTFKGPVTTNFVDNTNGIATFESCTFTKAASGNNYVMAMGGTHIFNACTFDYTGLTQSSIGIINNASINSSSDSDGTYSTVVILEACERINCGTRKYGPNSTLTIK